jgi:hypothetical protein
MGARDELSSQGLIDWSRAVVDGLARQICHGHLRYKLWWLPRVTWSVMVVVCWLSCWAARSGWALPPRLGHRHRVDQADAPFRLQLPSTVVIIVCAGA